MALTVLFWQFAWPQVSLYTLLDTNGSFVTFMEIGLNLVMYAVMMPAASPAAAAMCYVLQILQITWIVLLLASLSLLHGDRTQSGDICCGWQSNLFIVKDYRHQVLAKSTDMHDFHCFCSLNSPSESLLHFAWMYRKMTFNASEHSKKAASCTGFIVVPVTCFSRYSRTLSLLCNEELFSYENRFSFYQKKKRQGLLLTYRSVQ